eukprot:g9830.t1
MHAYVFLVAVLAAANSVVGHPICFVDDKSPDLEETLDFCPAAQDGACCTDAEEAIVKARFDAVGPLSNDCADYYMQVQCGQCHSYSGHLFADLGSELGVEDGMTMKSDFCEALVDACAGEIDFPTYDGGGTTYCEKHTGDQDEDFFWSYPYVEAEVFSPDINEVFPDLDPDDDFPTQTISMYQSPDASMYWLGGQAGEIKKVDADDMDSISTVLDISDMIFLEFEEGLLDFTFGPLFGVSGYPDYFYVSYTVQLDDGEAQRNRVSRFEYVEGSKSDTRNSEDILLTTSPKNTTIHAAGWCGFKPSDYGNTDDDYHDLYWTTGDAGPQNDPDGNGQNTLNLQGAVIRISVPSAADTKGYKIPSGNYGGLPDVLPELCAIGLRNPWRCSFDRDNDDLWCGDVGQVKVETINIIECGKNYGWSRFEGSRCQDEHEDRDGPCDGADRSGITFPVFEYCHPDYYDDTDEEQAFTNGVDICGDRSLTGHSVIGGYVYRGGYFADVIGGAYVFADNQNMNVYYIKLEDGKWTVGTIISDKSVKVVGFTEDIDGELMLISNDYKIYHLPCSDLCFQRSASMTAGFYLGCYADAEDRVLEYLMDSEDMTAEVCASACGDTPYFGTQYGRECWCGDLDTDFSQHGDGLCDYSCSGDTWELCGGYFAITAYAREDGYYGGIDTIDYDTRNPTPAPAPTTSSPVNMEFSYLGCFADEDGDGRVLSDPVVSDDMSLELCAGLCAGESYFGVQYGVECWCGDASTDISQHGTAICDVPCSGDSDTICGGSWAFSAYGSGDDDDASPPSPAPVAVAPSPSALAYSYLGCFADKDGDGRVLSDPVVSDDMTIELCAGLCAGEAYFGVQYGVECWCGDASADISLHGTSTCDVPCSGDGGAICGGSWAFSAYAFGEDDDDDDEVPRSPTTDPTGVSYVGCFADDEDARVMPVAAALDRSDMSTELCAALCAGEAYFGLQYGEECWCGDASTDLSQHGTAICDILCNGDSDTICGGSWALSVYEFVDDGFPPSPAPDLSGVSYVGCFADDKDARLMPVPAVLDSPDMSKEVCADLCAGSTFFGTQYGEECWCTDEASLDFDAIGAGLCNFPCTGDGAEICGGWFSVSVYEYDADGNAPTPTPSDEVCSNGVPGIENVGRGVCCALGCDGKCGGSGCSSFGAASGLGSEDCCVSGVIGSGVQCSVSGTSPCII